MRQVKKPGQQAYKVFSKSKISSKKKNTKGKISKIYEGNSLKTKPFYKNLIIICLEAKYQSNKGQSTFETKGTGFKIISRNPFLDNHSRKQHNSSLEEYNMKGKMALTKVGGHRRTNIKVNFSKDLN